MRRVNSKDNFPKIIREYLHQSDKTLIDLEIAMAQVFILKKHFFF